jgi:phage tail-like protein
MDTVDTGEQPSGTSSRRDLLKMAGVAGLAGVTAAAVPSTASGAGFVVNATSGTHFRLLIDGVLAGGVRTIEGPESDSDVTFTPDAGTPGVTAAPGSVTVQTVSVERDFSHSKEFFNWRQTVINGKVDRKSVSIIILSDSGAEIARYNFFECWPCRYRGPELSKSRSSAHATETIEIVFERMELK